jgi:hypothetical protein
MALNLVATNSPDGATVSATGTTVFSNQPLQALADGNKIALTTGSTTFTVKDRSGNTLWTSGAFSLAASGLYSIPTIGQNTASGEALVLVNTTG